MIKFHLKFFLIGVKKIQLFYDKISLKKNFLLIKLLRNLEELLYSFSSHL